MNIVQILIVCIDYVIYYRFCSDVEFLLIDCNNGDVRLVGGDFKNEGTVEVCIDNIWSLISDNIWNVANAMVVCNQLGYTGGSKLKH